MSIELSTKGSLFVAGSLSIDGMSDLASRLFLRLAEKPLTGVQMKKEFPVPPEELQLALDELLDRDFISQRLLSKHN